MTARRCDRVPVNATAAGLIGCALLFLGLALTAAAIDAKADGTVSEHSDYVFVGCDD